MIQAQRKGIRLKAYNYIYFYNHELSGSHSEVAKFSMFYKPLTAVKAASLSVFAPPHLIS